MCNVHQAKPVLFELPKRWPYDNTNLMPELEKKDQDDQSQQGSSSGDHECLY